MGDVRRPSTVELKHGIERTAIEHRIRALWNLERVPSFYNMSPNPVSILRHKLEEIVLIADRRKHYAIGAKTDGVRYMMVVLESPAAERGPVIVLVNRRCDMYVLPFGEKMPRNVDHERTFTAYAAGTVLDGELIATPHGMEYWVFDVVAVKGATLRHGDQTKNNSNSNSNSDGMRDGSDGPVYLREREIIYQKFVVDMAPVFAREWGIALRAKPFFDLSVDGYLRLQEWMAREYHSTDGFILAPLNEAVQQNTQDTMYKVKTSHTVDLLFNIDFTQFPHIKIVSASYKDITPRSWRGPSQERMVNIYGRDVEGSVLAGKKVTIRDSRRLFERMGGGIAAARRAGRAASPVVETVIECLVRVPSLHAVVFEPLKIRPDKQSPNNTRTMRETVENAREDITYAELQNLLGQAQAQAGGDTEDKIPQSSSPSEPPQGNAQPTNVRNVQRQKRKRSRDNGSCDLTTGGDVKRTKVDVKKE